MTDIVTDHSGGCSGAAALKRTIVYDTEFIENGSTIDLISIGMVDDSGREYYAVNSDMPTERIESKPWLMFNVVPHLPVTNSTLRQIKKRREHGENSFPRPSMDLELDMTSTLVKPHWVIANEIREYLTCDRDVELWADYGAYDHVALVQLFGTMMNLPAGVPMFTHELMQLWESAGRPVKPEQTSEHDALADARHGMAIWRLCWGVA